MTKAELRAMLADLMPAAIADGKLNHFQPFSKCPVGARNLPSQEVTVETRAVRPMRIYQRQGRMGAGFEIATHSKWAAH